MITKTSSCWLALASVIAVICFVSLSCNLNKTCPVTVTDPVRISEDVRDGWLQIAVIPEQCPASDQMHKLQDYDFKTAVKTVAAPISALLAEGSSANRAAVIDEIGLIPRKKYGFVALWRDAHCGITAWGCTSVDLSRHSAVEIALQLRNLTNPKQRCSGDNSVCVNAQCLVDDKAIYHGYDNRISHDACNLEVLDWGMFPPPRDQNAIIAGPSLVATPEGFIVTYAEAVSDSSSSRMLSWQVRKSGKIAYSLSPITVCDTPSTLTGFAALWDGNQEKPYGMLVAPTGCDPEAENGNRNAIINFFKFDAFGGFISDSRRILQSPSTVPLFMAPTHGFDVIPKLGLSFPIVTEHVTTPTDSQIASAYVFREGEPIDDSKMRLIDDVDTDVEFAQVSAQDSRITVLAKIKSSKDSGLKIASVQGNHNHPKYTLKNLAFLLLPDSTEVAISALVATSRGTMVVAGDRLSREIKWWHVSTDGNIGNKGDWQISNIAKSIDIAHTKSVYIAVAGTARSLSVYVKERDQGWKGLNLNKDFENLNIDPLSHYSGEHVVIAANGDHVLVAWKNSTADANEDNPVPVGGYVLLYCGGNS